MTIEAKFKYYEEVEIVVCGIALKGVPFIRYDYHEDGSVSKYNGIDLGKKKFKRLIKSCQKRERIT